MVNQKQLLYPQEVELHYIIPALRRDLTTALKKSGLEQKEIAILLNVTEPAISQYVKNKRASKVRFTQSIRAEIERSAKRLQEKGSLLHEIQGLLDLSKKEGVTCSLHCKLADIAKGCSLCH